MAKFQRLIYLICLFSDIKQHYCNGWCQHVNRVDCSLPKVVCLGCKYQESLFKLEIVVLAVQIRRQLFHFVSKMFLKGNSPSKISSVLWYIQYVALFYCLPLLPIISVIASYFRMYNFHKARTNFIGYIFFSLIKEIKPVLTCEK